MHGVLLALPLGRADQQERLLAVGAGAQLGLDAVAHRLPVARLGELRSELLQIVPVGADQIAALAVLQPGHGLGADHAAVHHPDAMRPAVARLHRADDLLDRGHVGAVAGEHLVAQRHALARHHQADADLLAVRPMVAAVAARGQRVGLRLALEVGAGHVVQQQLVVELEQLAQAALEMGLQRRLVRQQAVERAIQPIVVDALRPARPADRSAPSGDTSPRRCAARSTARTAGRSPGSPPSSTTAPARGRTPAPRRTARRAPAPATAASPARHRRTAASDPGAPAPAAPSPARRRAPLRTDRTARAGRSSAAPAGAPAHGPARRARQDAPPSPASPGGRAAPSAPAANRCASCPTS